MKKLMKVTEVADLLGLSPKTVYRLALERELPSVELTDRGSVRFDPEDVLRWVRDRKRVSYEEV